MELAIGDMVVYGTHGAGPSPAEEERHGPGEEQVVIVLALAHGLWSANFDSRAQRNCCGRSPTRKESTGRAWYSVPDAAADARSPG